LRLVDHSAAEQVNQVIAAVGPAVAEKRKTSLHSITILAFLVIAAIGAAYVYISRFSATAQIQSVAVLPFQNASGNSDIEYLSDGMTETLINSLSQLPNLSVKARSSVFRYKGKEVEPQSVAAELSVQAILHGRVMQRGDDLTLYLSLVDGRTGDQLWGEQYQRKLTDLLALQSEIARDISRKLRARLAGSEEKKISKNYTENVEAYHLYLKGRYHAVRFTPSETQKGISYYEQAIANDPSYTLAYVGLADAYRSLPTAGDVPPTELFPKAKTFAQKALEIDDTLAEAHAILGFTIFWHEWDWNEAENQYKRALELNPNSPDTHLYYAHLLSETGRHPEALAEVKRALELDPLSIYANTLEGQFLLHAGHVDEAINKLQKTFELAPNFWLAHLFASSAYTQKGMYSEAIAEARRSKELMPESSHSTAFAAYALAKSGKRAEARAALDELLRSSTERFIPPYLIALIYNSLDEHDKTFIWLERANEIRDPRMVFLKVEPKWNNLHSDPRFQDLLRRVGFTK
jgi:TolB-like protein/Tfp pilus assembly protein PilF